MKKKCCKMCRCFLINFSFSAKVNFKKTENKTRAMPVLWRIFITHFMNIMEKLFFWTNNLPNRNSGKVKKSFHWNQTKFKNRTVSGSLLLLDFSKSSNASTQKYFIDRFSSTVYTVFKELRNKMLDDNSIDSKLLYCILCYFIILGGGKVGQS